MILGEATATALLIRRHSYLPPWPDRPQAGTEVLLDLALWRIISGIIRPTLVTQTLADRRAR